MTQTVFVKTLCNTTGWAANLRVVIKDDRTEVSFAGPLPSGLNKEEIKIENRFMEAYTFTH